METNEKILLGLGIGVVAYMLYSMNKQNKAVLATVSSSATPIPMPTVSQPIIYPYAYGGGYNYNTNINNPYLPLGVPNPNETPTTQAADAALLAAEQGQGVAGNT